MKTIIVVMQFSKIETNAHFIIIKDGYHINKIILKMEK